MENEIINILNALTDEERTGALFGLNLYLTMTGKTRTPRAVVIEPKTESESKNVKSTTTNEPRNAPEYVFSRMDETARAKFRRNVDLRIWEPGLHAELVTRIIWLVDQTLLSSAQLKEIFENAEAEHRENQKPRWYTIGGRIRQIYETNGFEWAKTTNELEPRPEGFDENKRIPRRIPITQRLDPDYNPEREDRTPAAFRAFHSNDAVSSAVASVGHDVAAFDPATTGGVK